MPANPPNATPFFFAEAVSLSLGWDDCGILVLLLASFTCTVEGSASSLDILVLVSCSGSSRVTASSAIVSELSVVVVSCDAISSTGSAAAPDSADIPSAAAPARKGIVPQMPPPGAPPWSITRGEHDTRRRTPRADRVRPTCVLPRLYVAGTGAAPCVRFLTLVGIAVVERLAGCWPPLLAIADAPRPVMSMSSTRTCKSGV